VTFDNSDPPEGVNPSAPPVDVAVDAAAPRIVVDEDAGGGNGAAVRPVAEGGGGGDKQPPPKDSGHSVAKTFGIVAILTVLSKVAGLVRDIAVAAAYGTSVVADAYNFAYLFTGNILILFGGLGGPFHSSTVSILTPKKDQREASGMLVTQIMAITAVVLTVISIAMYFAAPYLVQGLKGVYAQMSSMNVKDMFEVETLRQLRIMLPLIVISGLVGVAYGVLNVYNRVVSASLSPAIASIAIIVFIWISKVHDGTPAGWALAVGTLAGAIGQLLVQIPSMAALKLKWKLQTKAVEGLADYSKMLWPAAFSTSIGQLTVYVDAFFALQQQAAWTAIVNSNRLVQLPLGILLTAMLVPILPRFTQQVNEDRIDDLKEEMRRSLRFLWFLGLPISAILLAIPQPIVQVLFMRGHFDEKSAALVTSALVFLTPSIFFYVARDLMTRVFYAYKDSTTPYRVAMIAIVLKGILDWVFVQFMERTSGISLATSVITVFNLALLTWALKKKTGNLGFSKLIQPLGVMIFATLVCGISTFGAYTALAHLHAASNTWWRLAYVAASALTGLLLYVAICIAAKLDEPVAVAKRLPVLRKLVR
jgi:putative peptidoglycan lipid II flippase